MFPHRVYKRKHFIVINVVADKILVHPLGDSEIAFIKEIQAGPYRVCDIERLALMLWYPVISLDTVIPEKRSFAFPRLWSFPLKSRLVPVSAGLKCAWQVQRMYACNISQNVIPLAG